MSTKQTFEINTEDYLGLGYDSYKNDVYALALSKPSEYFSLRREVMQKVKKDSITNIYQSFYNVLSKGQDVTGAPIRALTVSTLNGGKGPQYPAQKVSELALQSARTLDEILNEVIDIILPADYEILANKRAVQHSKGSVIDR